MKYPGRPRLYQPKAFMPLSVQEMHVARRKLYEALGDAMPLIHKTAKGEYSPTPQQVKTWQFLANKVLPDLSASHSKIEVEHKNVTDLTREQLEAILRESDPKLLSHGETPEEPEDVAFQVVSDTTEDASVKTVTEPSAPRNAKRARTPRNTDTTRDEDRGG